MTLIRPALIAAFVISGLLVGIFFLAPGSNGVGMLSGTGTDYGEYPGDSDDESTVEDPSSDGRSAARLSGTQLGKRPAKNNAERRAGGKKGGTTGGGPGGGGGPLGAEGVHGGKGGSASASGEPRAGFDPLSRGQATLIVEVIDSAHAAQPGVRVSLLRGRQGGDIHTDEEGIASFENIAGGRYTLQIRAEDLPTLRTASGVTLTDGEERELTLTIGRYDLTIAGRVLDLSGRGVPDIVVRAERQRSPGGGESDLVPVDAASLETKSAEEGRFELTGLDGADYRLITQKTAEFPATSRVFRGGVKTAELVLGESRSVEIFGVVGDREGLPVPDARIMSLNADRAVAYSDEAGAYRLIAEWKEGLSYYVIKASRQGYKEERVSLNELPEEQLRLDIELEDLGLTVPVVGTVTNDRGDPVRGEAIYLYSPTVRSRHSAVSGADGRYSFPEVAPAKDYRIWVHPRERYLDFSVSPLRVGDSGLEFDIVLEEFETGSIKGVFVDPDGRPVPEFTLWARNLDTLGNSFQVTSDARGRFRVDDVPAGNVLFETRSSPRLTVRGVEVKPGDEVDVRLVLDWGDGTVKGRVVSAQGAAVQGAKVLMHWSKASGKLRSTSLRNVITDDQGRFVFSELGSGEHNIKVDAEGNAAAHKAVKVGSISGEVEIKLRRKI